MCWRNSQEGQVRGGSIRVEERFLTVRLCTFWRSSVIIGFVRGKPTMDIPDPLLNVWTFLSRLLHLVWANVNEKKYKPCWGPVATTLNKLWCSRAALPNGGNWRCGQKQREGHVPCLPQQPGDGVPSSGPTLSWGNRTATRGVLPAGVMPKDVSWLGVSLGIRGSSSCLWVWAHSPGLQRAAACRHGLSASEHSAFSFRSSSPALH